MRTGVRHQSRFELSGRVALSIAFWQGKCRRNRPCASSGRCVHFRSKSQASFEARQVRNGTIHVRPRPCYAAAAQKTAIVRLRPRRDVLGSDSRLRSECPPAEQPPVAAGSPLACFNLWLAAPRRQHITLLRFFVSLWSVELEAIRQQPLQHHPDIARRGCLRRLLRMTSKRSVSSPVRTAEHGSYRQRRRPCRSNRPWWRFAGP